MTEFIFELDNKKRFSIQVPNVDRKCNRYYQLTEQLHKFDEAKVFFMSVDEKKELTEETISTIIACLYTKLNNIIHNKSILPNNIKPGQLGYAINITTNLSINDDLSKYWLWSSNRKCNIFLYTQNNKIYIEIMKFYPWTFLYVPKGGILFNQFLQYYQPFFVAEIDRKTVVAWQQKCYDVLKKIDALFLINPEE